MLNATDQVNEAQELTMDLAMGRSLVTLTRAVSVKWRGNNLVKIVQRVFVCLFIVGNEPVKRKN